MSELKAKYYEKVIPNLMKSMGVDNAMAVPRVNKIILNVGIRKAEDTPKKIDEVVAEFKNITGLTPQITKAKKSIAGFNIRQGDPVGVSVTLRGEKMFDFLEKLCRIVLPQVKDFRGVKSNAFDGHGNYSLGLSEQIIFPEIDYSKVQYVHGMEIIIVTSSSDDDSARMLLKELGMPFEKEE